jgi:small-conductance mechanosensitive channel
MPNLIWPRALSPQTGASGLIGRTIHWFAVAVAVLVLLAALGFAADGWKPPLAAGLAIGAVAIAMAARGVRYLLAHE